MKEEYIARITLRHAPTMNKREIKKVSKWLREKAGEIEKEHKEYADLFRATIYEV